MQTARNEDELLKILMPKLRIVVDYVMSKIEHDGQLKIEDLVYEAYNPTWYERTYDFERSFVKEETVINHNEVVGEYGFEPDMMSSYPELFEHGSPYGVPEDARNIMADIIFEGAAGSLFGDGPWRRKRNAWNRIVYMLGRKNLDVWMKQGFKRAGLQVE